MNIEYLNYTTGTGEVKQLPIRVSYFALKKTKEDTGRALSTVKDDDFDVYESLLFHSLQKGHQVMNTPFNFKKSEMEDLMDQVYFEFMKVIPKFFEQPKTPASIAKNPKGASKK